MTLKAGIIGLGIGEQHLIAYQNYPDCEVRAICDFSSTHLSNVQAKYGIEIATTDAAKILSDPEIDIVSIASYDNFHYSQVCECLENGKHVFVEKPLCLSFQEALSIRNHLNTSDASLSSNMVLRTCPRFINVKAQIESGDFGEVYCAEGDYFWGRTEKLTDGWRTEMPGYSIIYGASIHLVDLINWLIDEIPVTVSGMGNQICTRHSDFGVNDFSAILLKYPSGRVVKISAHGGCVHPHFHRVKIFGTQKTFSNSYDTAYWIDSCENDKPVRKDLFDYPARSERSKVIHTFLDSILNSDLKPMVTPKDVFEAMSVCFAAETAISENRTVKIEYI